MSNLYIKKFIERLEHLEARGQKDFNCSIQDAKRLSNEITNLLLALHEQQEKPQDQVIQVEMTGGSF